MPLCIDALKSAVAEAKRGCDLHRYRDAVECLRTAGPDEPESSWDRQWIEATDKSNKAEVIRLETELKGYKNNLIKECVRVSIWHNYHSPGSTLPLDHCCLTMDSECRWETKRWASTSKPLAT